MQHRFLISNLKHRNPSMGLENMGQKVKPYFGHRNILKVTISEMF